MRRSPGYGGHRTDRLRRRRPEVSVGEACGPLGNIILTIEHGDLGRLIAVRTDPGVRHQTGKTPAKTVFARCDYSILQGYAERMMADTWSFQLFIASRFSSFQSCRW